MDNFEKNFIRNNINPDSLQNIPEKLDIKIELAKPEDWEQCKDIRIKSLLGEDAKMLTGARENALEFEKKVGEKKWKEEISGKDTFIVLSKNGSEIVGIGRAYKRKEEKGNVWHLYNGYVLPEFRGKSIGVKMFGLRLKEIITRGGEEATTYIRFDNSKSLRNAEFFGFTKLDKKLAKEKYELEEKDIWDAWELDLKSPKVIEKINEVLDER